MTPNELVLTFGGLHLCVKFGENRQRNATVRVMTHVQTDRQTDRQTKTDFIICPICYSYETDNNNNNEYSCLALIYIFQPITLETMGSFSSFTYGFISDVGRRLIAASGDIVNNDTVFLFQRLALTAPTPQFCAHSGVFCELDSEPNL